MAPATGMGVVEAEPHRFALESAGVPTPGSQSVPATGLPVDVLPIARTHHPLHAHAGKAGDRRIGVARPSSSTAANEHRDLGARAEDERIRFDDTGVSVAVALHSGLVAVDVVGPLLGTDSAVRHGVVPGHGEQVVGPVGGGNNVPTRQVARLEIIGTRLVAHAVAAADAERSRTAVECDRSGAQR